MCSFWDIIIVIIFVVIVIIIINLFNVDSYKNKQLVYIVKNSFWLN